METRKLSELKPNPLNPRGPVVVDDSLRDLASSIRTQGLLQPVLITTDNRIVAGHRRAMAAEIAGLREIAVIEKDLTEVQQIEVMLVENMQRASLNIVQEGQAFLRLREYGLTNSNIAKAVGLCAETVKRRVVVASLAPECHPSFIKGHLPIGCADRLSPLTRDKQIYWVERAVRERWDGAALCRAISQARSVQQDSVNPFPEPTEREILDHLVESLEKIDKRLDGHDLKPAQSMIQQAVNLIVEKIVSGCERVRAGDSHESRNRSSLLNSAS